MKVTVTEIITVESGHLGYDTGRVGHEVIELDRRRRWVVTASREPGDPPNPAWSRIGQRISTTRRRVATAETRGGAMRAANRAAERLGGVPVVVAPEPVYEQPPPRVLG